MEYIYTVVMEPETEGGFSVFVPALPGCYSQGDTKEEALSNIQEAIQLYITDLRAENQPIPSESTHPPVIETVKIVA